jgi:hypothetical protein
VALLHGGDRALGPAIPVIETRRLVLRGPEPQDYPDFKATFASYRSRFMGGPLNPYETWMLYAAEIGHWEIRGYGMWMIHDRETDAPGHGGRLVPREMARAEIAWIIWPDKAGHGYALEATHAVRGHLYKKLGLGGRGQLSRPQEPRLDPPGRAAGLQEGSRGALDRRQRYRLPPPVARNAQIRPDPRRDRHWKSAITATRCSSRKDAR